MTPTPPPEVFKAYDVRGLYGDEIDEDAAYAIGRGFARVLGTLLDTPTGELRVGLGRDMRLTAPALAARYRDGMIAEGVHVIDAGMVGTEMLYWLVGARELDGGLMCTASHNPKDYTGAKMVERGALPLSGDRGLQDIRRVIEAGLPEEPGGGSSEEVDIYNDFHRAALALVDTEAITPSRVVVDGGNGMAGPMVGPVARAPRPRAGRDLLEARRHVPRPRAQPAARGEPPRHRRAGPRRAAPTSASRGTATPIAASSSTATGDFVAGDFITALLAESLLAKQPGATILYDVRASYARARHGRPRPAARRS